MSLLGIDIGTSVCKAAAFCEAGSCLGVAVREYATRHPQPGYAELDSHEVWRKVREVIAEVAARTRHDPVTALSVSSLGEAIVPVDQNRNILGPSILCFDSRGAETAAALERDFGQERFYQINPNLLGPYYSLPKILWLREHQPALFKQIDRFLLWGDFLGFMLGCDPYASNSLANRTLLFDLARNDWSEELLAWSGLERRRLGPIVTGDTVVGVMANSAAVELGLPRGVKIVAGGHDQCCNALGCGCIRAGQAVCGIGTFECLTPVYGPVAEPLRLLRERLNLEHHVLPELYVSFLYNQAGVLVKWFRDTFAAADQTTAGEDLYARLNRELPAEPTRLLVLPHFEAPLWPNYIPDSGGAILGLHTSTTRGEILKAIMEGSSFYFADSLAALEKMGIRLTEFVASGGGAKSDAWLQIKADIFGIPFIRPQLAEGGLSGAAMLAGLGTGVYAAPADAVALFVKPGKTFVPDSGRHAVYREKLALYRKLYPANQALLQRL